MSARVTIADPAAAAAIRAWPALGVLAGGALLWLLLFHAEAAAAARIWATSTAYGHCFLVLPVAAWLAWERRGALAGQAPHGFAPAVLIALPLATVWFAAERLGVMEGRQLAALALLLALALAVLGPGLWWAFAVPLLYLFFLVPFGGFLVGPLQVFTARFIDAGLDVLGIPHVVTRFIIEIPEGVFRVAEACAGLRFLIAAIAFGVVYACTLYRSPARRLAFIAASMVVPVIANGFRALGIVLLGHALGSAQAGAVDHVLYGWLFFSLVIVLLILAGLPFRQDAGPVAYQPRAAVARRPSPAPLIQAAFGVLLLASIAPAFTAWLDAQAARQQHGMPDEAGAAIVARLATPSGCTREAVDRFDCAGVTITMRAEVFAPRSSPATLVAAQRAATSKFDSETAWLGTWTLGQASARVWQVTEAEPPRPVVAVSLSAGSGLGMRLAQAWTSIVGGSDEPVLLTATAASHLIEPNTRAKEVLRRFLIQQEGAVSVAKK